MNLTNPWADDRPDRVRCPVCHTWSPPGDHNDAITWAETHACRATLRGAA